MEGEKGVIRDKGEEVTSRTRRKKGEGKRGKERQGSERR